jgi:hypothetical protein
MYEKVTESVYRWIDSDYIRKKRKKIISMSDQLLWNLENCLLLNIEIVPCNLLPAIKDFQIELHLEEDEVPQGTFEALNYILACQGLFFGAEDDNI